MKNTNNLKPKKNITDLLLSLYPTMKPKLNIVQRFIKNIKKKINYVKELILYGFGNNKIIDLNTNVAQYILPRLKRYRELMDTHSEWVGCPLNVEINVKNVWLTEEQWKYRIATMIEAFELFVKDVHSPHTNGTKHKYNEGMKYFSLYFSHLWI
jgi:UDP-N-acetylglucosamine transferase subunit ALG13